MEMNIKRIAFQDWRIETLEIQIRPVVRGDKIISFVVWTLKTSKGDLKIRGGTIKLKELPSGEELLSFDAPAYRAGPRYFKSFFLESDEFRRICAETVKFYCEQTGEVPPNYIFLDGDGQR